MADDDRIWIQASAGEVIDKITILEIKACRIDDAAKLAHVRRELETLCAARDRALKPSAELQALADQLSAVNAELWRIEDAIRVCELRQDFGPQFIELARSVYRNNDRRFDLKRRINELTGSAIVEVKSYPGSG
jgi:hypothetical protein